MRERQRILTEAVVRAEYSAAAARFDVVDSVAGDGLIGLSQQGLRVAEEQVPEIRGFIDRLLQPLDCGA